MTISGAVVDASGKPVRGARVYIAMAPGPVPDVAALTDRDGRFSLGAGRPGVYEIACSTDSLGGASATVEVGERGATVELRLAKP